MVLAMPAPLSKKGALRYCRRGLKEIEAEALCFAPPEQKTQFAELK
jgi:hypothetical protein